MTNLSQILDAGKINSNDGQDALPERQVKIKIQIQSAHGRAIWRVVYMMG